MEMYPEPEFTISAEDILLKLIRDVHNDWTGYGTRLWAERELNRTNSDEQLKLIEGEDEL